MKTFLYTLSAAALLFSIKMNRTQHGPCCTPDGGCLCNLVYRR